MRVSFGVPILSLLFCAPVFPQNSGSIQCDPSSTGPIPAWTAPQSLWVVEYLKCGQMVTIVGLELGYVKIQIGEQMAVSVR